jgi:hypothetical protein
MSLTIAEARERIIGGWKLISFTTTLSSPSGTTTTTHPMGSQPLGRILFSSDGWMSTIGNDPSKIIITSSPWITTLDAEIAEVARYMMSYWGAYTMFEEEGEVRLSTEVHVALDPSWVGTVQERRVEFREVAGRGCLVLKPVRHLPAPVS